MKRGRVGLWRVVAGLLACAAPGLPDPSSGQPATASEPIRRTLDFRGTEREYFIRLPPAFDRKKSYWPLVIVHGRGGNCRASFLARLRLRPPRGFASLDASLITPR